VAGLSLTNCANQDFDSEVDGVNAAYRGYCCHKGLVPVRYMSGHMVGALALPQGVDDCEQLSASVLVDDAVFLLCFEFSPSAVICWSVRVEAVMLRSSRASCRS